MSRISLKNIFSAKSDAYTWLSSLTKELNASVQITDNQQRVVFGIPNVEVVNEESIQSEGEIIGWVKGDEKSTMIASFVNLLVQKESEKKKLGNEVLLLYQEVNLIFNFSEKLAQAIGQNKIADITLDEARRLIRSDHGFIVLWDEESNKMEILAESGKPVFNAENWKANVGLLRNISRSGQSEIMSDLSPLQDAGLIVPDVQALLYAALKVKHRVMGAIVLSSNEPIQYTAADLKFLITLALQSSSAIESAILYEKNIREAEKREEAMRRIYEVTNKFVPHEFIHSLGRDVITDIRLGDQVEKIVTVLFSDIRDYTTMAEQMTPEENFSFVCSFNERVGPIIRECHGFINQYLGDAIMAIFPGNASDALSAAIKMQRAVQELNAERIHLNKPPIKVGVGMHTGPLIMGITGDHERFDATTIADTVNIASRLESLTKHYRVNILLSEACISNLTNADDFHFRHLGLIQLKGKLAPISIYECFNGMNDLELNKKLTSLPYYRQAMIHYFGKSFLEATNKFYKALEIFPDDTPAKLFLGKATKYLYGEVPENWNGVDEMHNK